MPIDPLCSLDEDEIRQAIARLAWLGPPERRGRLIDALVESLAAALVELDDAQRLQVIRRLVVALNRPRSLVRSLGQS